MASDELARLRENLRTCSFGHVHEHYREIASTNDRALAWAQEGAPHGALVSADAQTAGRGRRGRVWSSPPGEDLYFSVIVRPGALAGGLAPAGWGAYGLAVGVALREGIGRWLADDLALKWPNDLLWRGRKLAGILCEGRWQAGALQAIVVGVGVNCGRRRFEDPALADRATSLALALAAAPGRAELLAELLLALEATTAIFASEGGFAAIRGRYEEACELLGRAVVVPAVGRDPEIRGVAVGLDDDGALLVREAKGGPSRRIEAADVWLASDPGRP
ncbi:MAG: biotin--[acetyl-CoA-carboxylase] ligase [Myxococcales bacterium]|nr:biotin--[acetyl-CoA-carboxylase] ligase [Myxococcales bacterium]